MTFRGPIWVPKVSFWGFWGLVCIEKWSQNFDSDTRSAISGTPKMTPKKIHSFSLKISIKNLLDWKGPHIGIFPKIHPNLRMEVSLIT